MTNDERVSRRDAVAGLGLLAVLMIALVGTIVYRIVNSSPHVARPTGGADAIANVEADATVMAVTDGAPQATSVDAPQNAVRPASHSGEPEPGSPMTEAPRFVAPTLR